MAEEASSRPPVDEGDYSRDPSTSHCEYHSNADLKHLIADDTYRTMQLHFLMKGKGRRPSLPPVKVVTNGLLLQLHFLKEEDKTSFQVVKHWLNKLVPSTSNVTEGKIRNGIISLLKQCSNSDKEQTTRLLKEQYNFINISSALGSHGLNEENIYMPENYLQTPSEDISNEVVVALSQIKTSSKTFVRKWLLKLSLACQLLSDNQLRQRVTNTLKKYGKILRNQNNNDLSEFLKKPFIEQKSEHQEDDEIQQAEEEKLPQESEKEVEICYFCINKDYTIRAKDELLQDNDRRLINLEQENASLISSISQLKKNGEKLESGLEETRQTRLYYKRNILLQRKNQQLEDRITDLEEKLKRTNSTMAKEVKKQHSLKRKIKFEQTMKSKYRKEKKDLAEGNERVMYALNNIEEDITFKENHHNLYSDNVRQLYMSLQGEANVASAQATKIVRLVAKHLFNKEFSEKELPCPKTCLNFMDEAHYIAKRHVMESIDKSQYFTYGSDGTGREKQRFVEHHIVLNDGTTLSLGFSEVPNDKADTLLEKSLDLFDELTDVYCDVNSTAEKNSIFRNILGKLRCLMSDRAANMKLFNKKMLDVKKDLIGEDAAIEFLHCNAHFLLALADATEKAAKSIEKSLGKLGRDNNNAFFRFSSSEETAACRVIRLTANVLGPRGDEKNGCRQEWLAHCDNTGVKSTFTSYRSNRFNNLFENAIALLFHKKETLHFLEECVSHKNLLIQSLCIDQHDKNIMSIVTGIALFASFVTCPYWKLMNSATPYGQFPDHVKSMKIALGKWLADNYDLHNLPKEAPIFGFKFEYTSKHIAIEFFSSPQCDAALASSTFKQICTKSLDALDLQLADFLPGGVYGGDIPTALRNILNTCPLTNLTGERLFGDLDYDMTKRRTACTHLRSTISMLKHNKTSTFLEQKTPSEINGIMSTGRKHGKTLKEKHKSATEKVRDLLKTKLKDNELRKKEKELQEIERRAALMTDIIAQGGICHTKDDLDRLMEKPQRMQNLKSQIRFHKLYMNAPELRLTGNFNTLYAGLCNHFGISVNQAEQPILEDDHVETEE